MSTLAYALLARIAREPQTGYSLAQVQESTLRNYWGAKHSQIYPALSQLEADGYVVAREEPGPGPRPKRTYAITDAGREALVAWARGPVGVTEARDEFCVHMDAAWLLPREDVVRLVREERERHEAALARYEETRSRVPAELPPMDDPLFGGQATLRLGMSYERHRIDWCTWFLQEIGEE